MSEKTAIIGGAFGKTLKVFIDFRSLTIFTATVCASACVALSSPLTGRASVIDGDTLEVRGERIRLHGIDAPESRQLCDDPAGKPYRCGQVAAIALADMIGWRNVRCFERDVDRWGRIVAECFVGEFNLNAEMVRAGHALAFRRYSRDYIATEDAARLAGRGLWAGRFDPPWQWRNAHR